MGTPSCKITLFLLPEPGIFIRQLMHMEIYTVIYTAHIFPAYSIVPAGNQTWLARKSTALVRGFPNHAPLMTPEWNIHHESNDGVTNDYLSVFCSHHASHLL